MPEDTPCEDLMAYHRILYEQQQGLAQLQAELDERRRHADASSQRRAALSASRPSSSGHTPANVNPRHQSRLGRIPEASRHATTRNLESSFMSMDAGRQRDAQNTGGCHP